MMQHVWDTQGYYAADAGRAGFGPRLSGSGIRALLEMPWLKTIQSEVPLSDELARRLNDEFFSIRPQVTVRLYTNGHHLRYDVGLMNPSSRLISWLQTRVCESGLKTSGS